MQKAMDMAEKVIGRVVDAAKETSKEMKIHTPAKERQAIQPERKKIPFPVKPHQKADVQDKSV